MLIGILIQLIVKKDKNAKLEGIVKSWLVWMIVSGLVDEKWGDPHNLDSGEKVCMLLAYANSFLIINETKVTDKIVRLFNSYVSKINSIPQPEKFIVKALHLAIVIEIYYMI